MIYSRLRTRSGSNHQVDVTVLQQVRVEMSTIHPQRYSLQLQQNPTRRIELTLSSFLQPTTCIYLFVVYSRRDPIFVAPEILAVGIYLPQMISNGVWQRNVVFTQDGMALMAVHIIMLVISCRVGIFFAYIKAIVSN